MPIPEIISTAIGEVIVLAIIVLVYALLGRFSYKVLLGATLGSVVMIINFVFLSLTINRAFDRVMDQRQNETMSEEEAAEFSAKHQAKLAGVIQMSQIVRMLSIVAVLALAFITDQFDIIATIIPIVAFQPILTLSELFFKRKK